MILAFPSRVNLVNGEAADGELVLRGRQGGLAARHGAYTVLVTRYEKFIRAMLMILTRHHALADDLSQDTFLTAWQKLNTLTEPEKFGGWLKQMAYRHFLHSYRRRQTEHKHRPIVEDGELGLEDRPEVDDELNQLLALCNPIEREIMILCFGFEFTHKEIAQSRGMAVGTVKSHVHRARQKMQNWLEQEPVELVDQEGKNNG